MSEIRLLGRARLTGHINLLSGLHIGAGKDTIEIGGIDNPVIKHPHTGEPYIPGSSLKGKLRFLLEWAFDRIRADGLPWGANDRKENSTADPDDPLLRLFGTPIKRDAWTGGPTRLLVRDALLNDDWRHHVTAEMLPLTEEKTEVVIDRIAGKAHNIGPRHTERVPAGTQFDLEMVVRIYDLGDGGRRDEECLNWLIAGLQLLELDALGGSGSRGYGRIRFSDLVYHDLDGATVSLDNRFRTSSFNPQKAPDLVRLRAA